MVGRKTTGFALLLVLILVMASVVMGAAYLSMAATQASAARNYTAFSNARYLAESGLNHGLYLLRYNPAQFGNNAQLGPYTVSGASGSYYLSAAVNVDGSYTLTSRAVIGSAAFGNVQRSVSATVARTPAPIVPSPLAKSMLVNSGFLTFGSNLTVNGDMHVNGWIMNNGATFNGDVTATRTITQLSGAITGQTSSYTSSIAAPDLKRDDYKDYKLGGTAYRACDFTDTDILSTSSITNGGSISAATNVGGVANLTRGAVRVRDNVVIDGTLVIDGNLTLDGANIVINAQKGFPALVVNGTIYIGPNARNITINGMVVVTNGVQSSGATALANMVINGSLAASATGVASSLPGHYTVNFDPKSSQLYNTRATDGDNKPQVLIVSWND